MRKTRSRLLLSLLIATLVSACDEAAVEPEEVVRQFWVGTYVSDDRADRGAFVLDVTREGGEVTGELVFRSRVAEEPFAWLFLRGRQDRDRLTLELDDLEFDYPFRFSLEADATADDRLEGSFSYSPAQLAADLEGRRVELAELSIESTVETGLSVKGLAFDDTLLWISPNVDEYKLMSLEGDIVDSLTVFVEEDIRWTTDALTWDGTRMYGGLSVRADTGSVTLRFSWLMGFDRLGVIRDTIPIPHRTEGLASDGTGFWSLPTQSDRLIRFGHDGAVLDSVPVAVPDLADLEFDGDHFWAPGFFMRRLYELDRNGELLRVYDLPINLRLATSVAIAHDGARIWFADNTTASGARLYSLGVDD